MSDLNSYPESSPAPLHTNKGSETYERRALDVVVVRLKAMHEDVDGIKSVLKDLTVAINRLALVEERQTQTANALERAFATMKEIEGRISKLELANVNTSRTSALMDKLMWGVIAAVGAAVLTLVLIGAKP
jgi:hypothetical protein